MVIDAGRGVHVLAERSGGGSSCHKKKNIREENSLKQTSPNLPILGAGGKKKTT